MFDYKLNKLGLNHPFSHHTAISFSALAPVTGCAAHNLFAPDASDVCLTALQAGLLRPASTGTFVVRIVPTRTPALVGGGGAAAATGAALAGVEFQGCTANGMLL